MFDLTPEVGTKCAIADAVVRLSELLVHVSPAPLTVDTASSRRWNVRTRSGRQVASFVGRAADAELFVRAEVGLRVFASAITEVAARHVDDGNGRCRDCGQVVPCTTRTILTTELAPLTESA